MVYKKIYLTKQSSEQFDTAVSDFIEEIKTEGQKTIHDRLISRGYITEKAYPLKTFYSDIRNAKLSRTGIFLKPELLFAVMQVLDVTPTNIFRPQIETNKPVYLHEKSVKRIIESFELSRRKTKKKETQPLEEVLFYSFQLYNAVNILAGPNEICSFWYLFINGSLKIPRYYPHGKKNRDLRAIDLVIQHISRTFFNGIDANQIQTLQSNQIPLISSNQEYFKVLSRLLVICYILYTIRKLLLTFDRAAQRTDKVNDSYKIKYKTHLTYSNGSIDS
jgi:hypothetical protein